MRKEGNLAGFAPTRTSGARLVHLQPAIFLAPAIIRLLGNADLAADLADRTALRQKHIRFPKVIDDLLNRTLFRHSLLPSPWIQKPGF